MQIVEKRDVLPSQKYSLPNSQGSSDSIPEICGSLLQVMGKMTETCHWGIDYYYETGWNFKRWELIFGCECGIMLSSFLWKHTLKVCRIVWRGG
jgi:hypothetical protein